MTLKHVLKHFNKTEVQEDERFSLAPMREREELLCEQSELSNSGEGCKDLPSPDATRHPLPREGNKASCAKHTVTNLFTYLPIHLFTFKKVAFTLAEVLITLGIIGIVAAITISSIKHIRYAGYAQTFLKTYSEIQQAHNNVVSKYGDPSTWPFTVHGVSVDNSGNEQIASWYMDEFKTTQRCMKPAYWHGSECGPAIDGIVKYLSGEYVPWYAFQDPYSYSMLLPDGRLIQIGFHSLWNNVAWGYPKLFFVVDLNGRFKKPNQLGRDIFLIAMDTNSSGQYVIQPIMKTYDRNIIMADTCKPDSTGYSCSENIIRDQAMKY